MTHWTEENTEGFTADEIETLNVAQARIEAANPGIDPTNIADRLNNVWTPGATVETLIEDAGFQK